MSLLYLSTIQPNATPAQRFPLMRRSTGPIVLLLLGYLLFLSSAESALAIDAPNLLAPADTATTTVSNYPPLGIPNFSWGAVGGATVYRIQFSQDIGFSTILFEATTPNTSYTPTSVAPFGDGNWYWRVRVEAPVASLYSPFRVFTKQWASASNLPILNSPADSAGLEFYDQPNFSWQPVIGASSYRFQVASNPSGFASPLYDQSTLAFTLQPAFKFANGTYYWRVVPKDPAGRNGTPSDVLSFMESYTRIPALIEPADNSTPTFTPTFRWNAVRGAQFYHLQYSTDPTFNANLNTIDTRNTTFTPNTTLPNDVNFYWRVRTISGDSISDWSTIWTFIKRWYIQAELLTPTNNFINVTEPFFSWSPVPAARSYQIEVSSLNSFPPVCGFVDTAVNTFYVRPRWVWESSCVNPINPVWYWRVTPIDSGGNMGKPSSVFSFVNPSTSPVVPRQIAPFYYYTPTVLLQPHEDRSVPYPGFSWHRIISPPNFTAASSNTTQIAAYRVEVSSSPLFLSVNWTYDTENMNAAPSAANPFNAVTDDYFWRVRALDSLGGSFIGPWSQIWKTRIDGSLALTTTNVSTPTLLRPVHAAEWVETMPLFEWIAMPGADSYTIDISRDPNFASIDLSANSIQPLYAPVTRFPCGQCDFGTYYWRVRGRNGGFPVGAYSHVRRFQIAAQSRWRETRTLGAAANRIGTDPAGDMTNPNYDLSNLYVSQSKDYWYFGFNVGGIVTTTFVLYLDLDHAEGSGATNDALDLNVNTIAAHRPEFAIYLLRHGSAFSLDKVFIFPWTGTAWGTPQTLDSIGGDLSSASNYVEIRVPNTAIGMEERTSSASISLFSVPATVGHAQDTVPSDPNVAFTTPDLGVSTTTLSRFASVSEKLNLAIPPNNIGGDPTQDPSVLPFLWHQPVDVPAWIGYNIQVHKDPQYTSLVHEFTIDGSPLIPPDFTYNLGDLAGDNTYYWRTRPMYFLTVGGRSRGAWNQPTAFERQGFVPQNLATSVTFATPTFSWNRTEGSEFYQVQVDDDPNYGSPVIDDNTAQNSYTPSFTLANGTYHWRLRVKRGGGTTNEWTQSQVFVLDLPKPTGLTPPAIVSRAPTLCWNPVVNTSVGTPVFAAWRYRIQMSLNDPTFSSIFDSIDTEQACWTSQRGLNDGTYYWHAAVIDGQGRLGAYTPPITATNGLTFTKQYPVTTLQSPPPGAVLATTPTFGWTTVNGAALYRLQVSKVIQFAPIYDEVVTNNTHYTPNRTYDSGVTYFWRVAMIDQEGRQGPYVGATLILDPLGFRVYLPAVVR